MIIVITIMTINGAIVVIIIVISTTIEVMAIIVIIQCRIERKGIGSLPPIHAAHVPRPALQNRMKDLEVSKELIVVLAVKTKHMAWPRFRDAIPILSLSACCILNFTLQLPNSAELSLQSFSSQAESFGC